MRYRRYREIATFEGGADVMGAELPELVPDLAGVPELCDRYKALMSDGWLFESDPPPQASDLYLELVITILTDAMTEADSISSDDFYHAIVLLSALRPEFRKA
jgi:hypothetical protein